MTYVLHYAPDNASLIIRMALEHCGAPYETALVDRSRNAQHSNSYRIINPNGLIPALETEHGPVFETGAILMWLAERHDGLAPPEDHPDRNDFLKWLFYTANTLHPAMRMMFYPQHYIGPAADDQLRLQLMAQTNIKTALDRLDTFAGTGPDWLTPSALSFYLVAILRWCALYPKDYDKSWFDLDATPHLADMCRRVETMDCARVAQQTEGLGPTPFSAPTYATPPEGTAT